MHRIPIAVIGFIAITTAGDAVAQTSRTVTPRPAVAAPTGSRTLLPGTPTDVFATIHGTALTSTNSPVANSPVRLRDTRRGRIVAELVTDKAGTFVFGLIDPSSYVVELVGRDGWVLAASEMVSLGPGESLNLIVKLPGLKPEAAGMLGTRSAAAASVLAAAAATGVLARTTTGQPISPR